MNSKLEDLAAEVKGSFNAFKVRRQKAEKALSELMQRRGELEAEEQSILGGPASKQDFIAALCAQVDTLAKDGRARVAETMLCDTTNRRQIRPVRVTEHDLKWSHVRDVAAGAASFGPGPMAVISASNPRDPDTAFRLDAVAVCMFFGEAIKVGLKASLAAIEWPYPEVMNGEARAARLAEITRELATSREQEETLAAMLADALAG